MKRCKIALILGMSAGALSYASAENLTWYGTGTQTWNDGIWRANGNSNVSWKDGSKATFTSSGKADVSIEGSVNVSGLVFENYSKAHSIQGGTLNTGANATIEKRGDFGAVISSAIPVYHGRQDVPNTSDPRLAICVSGQRAITSNLHGGLAAGYTYSGTNVVYWRNRRLSDISGFASADFHRNTGSKCLGAKPFFYENNGTTASVQFQYKASDPWTYASKVTFTQRGDDILAKIDYWRARKIPYGEDMSPSTPQTQYGEENIGGQKVWDDVSTSSGGNWTVCNIIAEENTKGLTVVVEDGSENPGWANHGLLPAVRRTDDNVPTYSGDEKLLWYNRSLDELDFQCATLCYENGTTKHVARPYNRKIEEDGRTSVQFRARHNDAGLILCAKVFFRQVGNNIKAQIFKIGAKVVDIERDWDDEDIGFPGGMQIIYDNKNNKKGWGVCDIKAAKPADGALKFPEFLPAHQSKWGFVTGEATLLWEWRNINDIEFGPAKSVRFSNVHKIFEATPYNRKVETNGRTSVQYRFYHNSSGSVLCFKVYFWQGWNGVWGQIAMAGATNHDVAVEWVDNDFEGARQQIYDNNLSKTGWGLFDLTASRKSVAPVEFSGLTELPENLTVSGGELKLTSGADFSFTNGTISGNGTLHLVGGTFKHSANATSTLAGKLVIDEAEYRVNGATGDKVCGSGAEIEVVNGGKLITTNGAKNAIGSSNVKMYVGPGSKFSENNGNFNLNSVALTVDGGRCELNNASTYIQDLTVRNGAQITESGRVGSYWFGRNSLTPVLTCDGVNEVTIAAHMRLYKNENKSWSPDVQYLTVKTLADLRITGGFMMASQTNAVITYGQAYSTYSGMRIRKTGPAKLIFDYSQDDFQREVWPYTIEQCVDEGTLELAKSAAIVTTQPLSLYGNGSIQVDDGTVNAGGALTVGGENSINIVGNGQISFSSLAITGNARLDINGDVGDTSFKIGTGKCLDSDALSKIRINGRGVCQDDSGYLRTCGFGLSLW